MEFNNLLTKISNNKYIFNEVDVENFFTKQILEIEEETFITPDLNGDEFEGSFHRISLILDSENINKFCDDLNITSNNLFLSISSFVMSKFIYSKNLLFSNDGVIESNSFENVPLILNLNTDLNIKSFLSQINDVWLNSLIFHDKLLEIVNECGYESKFLYQFNSQDTSKKNYNLILTVLEHDNDFEVICNFNDSLYSPELIDTFLNSISIVFNKIVKLSDDELENTFLKNISIVSRDTPCAADLEFSPIEESIIHRIFEKQVAIHGSEVILTACDGEFSYGDLNKKANSIANALIKKGVGLEDRIMMVLKRDSNVFAAILGILKAGAAFIPIDSDYPKERIEHVLADSESKFIIFDDIVDIKDIDLSSYSDSLLHIDELLKEENTFNPDVNISPENLAYMIYTSGSTGLPKGVMIEHGNFANFVTPNHDSSYCWELVTNGEKENYKILSMVTIAFDTFLEEAILPILNNVPVVFADDDQYKDPLALIDLIKDNQVNVFDGTPSRLLQYLEIDDLKELIADFKIFVVGGEAFPKHLYNILSKVSDGKIYNSYGPTEITIVSNDKLIDNEDVISVGKPIFNVYEEIMDLDENPLPPHVLGELYIAGNGVSRSYHNRPEKNAEVYKIINGVKYYRSGDLAKWNGDGEVEILGRLDNQIKLRGLRIEIGEVESAIKEFEGIESLAVVVQKVKGSDHLCAYFTVYDGYSVDVDELKNYLNGKLTYYMVPTVYMELDEIPQTANGKTDIKNLPEPSLTTENVLPKNDIQRKLYEICSEILDFKDFGVTDNLFSLGFSSLLIMKLSHEIYSEFGIVLSFKVLMDAGNIIDLEDLLNNANKLDKITYEKQEYYPLSHNQLNVYIESVKNPDKLIYNMAFVIDMGEDINPARLKKSLINVFNHHSYLKSIITQKDGEVYLKRQDNADVLINIVNKKCSDKVQKNFIKAFDLLDSPLYRAEIYNYNNKTTLLLDIHHIIFDGISLNIFIENLINDYQGRELLNETYTGFEYILEDYAQIDSDSYKESEEFFSSKIKEIDISTDISPNITKPIENAKLGEYYKAMSKNHIDEYCKKYNITPNNLFLSATLLTLSKYTYTKDMLIATISSGRLNPNYENTLAMVVKTLPFIHRIDTAQNVGEFFNSVQNTLTQTVNHENYPYTKLFEQYNINPNIYYAYQVGLDEDEKIINDEGKINYLDIKEVSLDLPKFNLSVYIEEDKDNYLIFLRYNDALYSGQFIENLTDNIELMVNKLQDDFNKTVGNISLLPAQKEEELTEIHSSFENIEFDTNLKELFENSVEKFSDEIALVDNTQTFSYSQLNKLSNRIANSLIDLGISSKDHVILKLERSYKLISAIYAVIKTGASFTIVSTEQPEEQTEFIKQDTNAKLIIGSNIDALLDNEDESNFDVDIKSDDIACIVYTSGSTGKPKGVLITHKGLINYINPRDDNIAIHAIQNDVSNMLSLTTTTFIAFLREVLATIINGTKVTLASDEESKNLSKLIRLLIQSKVDGLSLTPSRIQEYMKVTEFKDLLNQFKVITIGGEKFIPSVYDDLSKNTNAKLFNSYGSSENTIATHQKLIDSEEITEGTPIPNNIDLIIDIDGNPLPNNITGEICTAGVQTTPGYLNRDDLNESEFITVNNLRFYKTGDLAFKNSNDELVIKGRKDKQIKLRGQRIEPGEIESVISKYPNIENVVVTVKQINNQDSLCAYYTSLCEIDVGDLKNYLSDKLIRYMIPTSFTKLDSMPKTPNGKIDIKNLPVPVISTDLVRAENELEENIFEICAEIVGFNDFGVTDNLYELGFTSLTIMRLSTEIYNVLDKEINVTLILQNPTIRSIAENIEIADEVDDNVSEKIDDEPQYYKLTPNQLGVYFDCVKDLEKVNYNLPKYIDFGRIDENRLKNSIIKVINSHSYLKTRIVMNEGVVYQERRDDLIIDDLIEIVEVNENIDDKFKQDFIKPFDLSEGPLFRFKIIKYNGNVSLLCDFHHIILDGTSLNILFRQIALIYDNPDLELDGKEIEPLNGFDYSQKEVKIQESSHYKESELFFFNEIKDHDEGSLIAPDLNGSEEEGNASEEVKAIDKGVVDKFSKEVSITPNNLFLSISSFVLSKFVNSKNLLFATITNGRFTPDEQDTLAMMVKTLPLSLKLNSDMNFREYFEYTNKEWVNTLSYSSYPFTEIVNKYGIIPEFLYAFDGKIIEDIEINGKLIERESLEYEDLKFKLNLEVTEVRDKYYVACQYNDALYSSKLINTFLDSIIIVINKLAKLNAEELDEVFLKDISIIERDIPHIEDLEFTEVEEPLIHRIFEKYVESNGEDVIFTASDGDFTYNELNEKANRIANALIKKGVGVEDRVMFVLKRDSNVFTSIVGILKSGAAFIPVDSDYPAERIEHVLTDSESKFIIFDDIVDIKDIDLSSYSDSLLHIDELLEEENTSNPDVDIAPENLAYMIYTSGSTGLPKGVMIEHRNFTNFINPDPANSYCHELVSNADKENYKILSLVTVAFDTFLDEVILPILNGVPVVFADDNQYKDSLALIPLIKKTNANVFDGTPSRLLQYLEIDGLKELIADFKIFVVGGEVFPKHLYDILSKVSEGKIFNSYGPTEITIACNDKLINQPNVVSVGRPMFNVYEEIMDIDSNPLPPNVLGELYVAGMGVSRAYYNRPDKNEEAFKTINGIKFYRTGDLAKWDDNGEVEILGRLDDQIKLRGLRIEIGEIESAIKEFEGIKSLAVVVRKIKGNDHLCAYFTVYDEYKNNDETYSIDIEALKDYLSSKLTYYMVPTVYMELDEMPQTLNGKTDLRNLPEPVLITEYVAPENDIEAFFADTFSEILDIDKVGVTDNFFEIGGTSLLVTKITIAALNRDFNITYGDVFDNPTPRKLAEYILSDQNSDVSLSEEFDYDYSAINELLDKNTLENFITGQSDDLGDILLTGATGFLGIHVLRELLENNSGKIYCLIRSRDNLSSLERLKSLLFYYFSDNYDDLFDNRVYVVEGDITSYDDFEKLVSYNINTIINCAANVKHFSSDTDIEDINLGGVLNGLKFAKLKQAKYVQVSTYSVAGESINNFPPADYKLNERDLFIGQSIDNQYIRSKFLAERAVLEAAVETGIPVKIMRVGNLMARSDDGEFQINFDSNGFVNQLKAFITVGKMSYSMLADDDELSPIDVTAKSIVELSKTPNECVVFHPYQHHTICFGDIIEIIKPLGLYIDAVEEEEYEYYLNEVLKDKNRQGGVSGLITSIGSGKFKKVWIDAENDYTVQVLYRLGIKWPIISQEYIYKFIEFLNDLAFFD